MQSKTIISFLVFSFLAVEVSGQSLIRGGAAANYMYKHYDEFGERQKAKLKRYYFGISKPSMSFNITQHYVSSGNTSAGQAADVTTKINVPGGVSYGNLAGTFFPIYRTGHASAVGFDLAVNGEVFNPRTGPIYYEAATVPPDEGDCMIIGLPIGIVYKSGGEVSLNKHDKVLFTMGFGVAPMYATSDILVSGSKFTARRFAMVEFGLFTGFAWKVRATYYSGNVDVLNTHSSDLSIAGSSDFNLSLVILPFSIKWDK